MTEETRNGPWYASRKLWVALGAALLCAGTALGGHALGMSEALITTVVTVLGGITAMLLGAHTWSDVTAMRTGAGQPSPVESILGAMSTILPVILQGTGTVPVVGPSVVAMKPPTESAGGADEGGDNATESR